MLTAFNPCFSFRRLSWPISLGVVSCISAIIVMIFVNTAAGEVYLSDAGIEISGTGSRISRNCRVLLKPTMVLGDQFAPRLILVTNGQSHLSFGVENAGQYSNVVIVQNNTRKLLASLDNVGVEQFRASDLAKVLASQRLFFVTAKRNATGKYVSSRYERIDFDTVLAKVGMACPFDSESLVADLSQRESAERALSVSKSDLTLIRWALNKRYGGISSEPEPRSTLSQAERLYLKRNAADSGFPLSQYLTKEIARLLILQGQSLAREAKRFTFEVCNRSTYQVAIAISGRENVDSNDWTLAGWRLVEAGACSKLGIFARGKIYAIAQVNGDSRGWYGDSLKHCIEKPGPFRRVLSASYSCPANGKDVGFNEFNVTTDSYTWTLDSPPIALYSAYFTFKVCNNSRIDIQLAASHRVSPTGGQFKIRGWWTVETGNCKELTFPKGWFYFYGEQKNRGSRKYWAGDQKLCVTYPGPFDRINTTEYTCDASRLKGFISKLISSDQDTYTVNLNN